MVEITHSQARAFLHDSADGLLALDDRLSLEAHLARCAECRAFAGGLEAAQQAVVRALQARLDGAQPSDLSRRVSQQLAASPRRRTSGWRRLGLALAAVTALALGVLAWRWWSAEPPTPAPPVAIEPGSKMISPNDGMRQVFVPAGWFQMGTSGEQIARLRAGCPECGPEAFADELPARRVYLDAFWIDETEVTNAQYERCVAAGQCRPPGSDRPFGRQEFRASAYADHPVVFVTWDYARQYCAWAGRRLPTEAEWERAARGDAAGRYPWGDDAPRGPFNEWVNFCPECRPSDRYRYTAPVGSFPRGASPYGALDMAGNVAEWVNDWYAADYYARPLSRREQLIFAEGGEAFSGHYNPLGPALGEARVLRGGSWNSQPWGVRSTRRDRTPPEAGRDDAGIRCAQIAVSDHAAQVQPGPAAGLQGRILFESRRDDNAELYLLDLADLQGPASEPPIANLTRHPADDVAPAWSPDGRRVAFISRRTSPPQLFVMNADGGGLRQLTDDPGVTAWGAPLAWSLDGTDLFVMRFSRTQSQLFRVSASGGGAAPLFDTPPQIDDYLPEWSPDGRWMVFRRSFSSGRAELMLWQAGALTPTAILEDEVWTFAWAPDGARAAYYDGEKIVRRDLAGDATSTLFEPPEAWGRVHNMTDLAWSPDGARLLFGAYADGWPSGQIFTIWADGSGLTALSDAQANSLQPAWSPDSRWVAYASDQDGNMEIYVVRVADAVQFPDRLNPLRLTWNLADDTGPRWQPPP